MLHNLVRSTQTTPFTSLFLSSTTTRTLHITPTLFRFRRLYPDTLPGHDPCIQQGIVSKPGQNRDGYSPHQQAANSGYAASSYCHPHDTATSGPMERAPREEWIEGNPEGIGSAEQVGGQSAFARRLKRTDIRYASEAMGVKQSTAPGMVQAAKRILGMGTRRRI